jgi:hypothetical protein
MMRHMEYMKMKLKEVENNTDMVNSPAHYNKAGIETIDIIESVTGDGFETYLQGNILKYICRYKYKNGVEDLEKARWYLNRLIETQIGEEYNGV